MGQKTVAIIGAGLVGALQACYLQKRGYKVSVYEIRSDFREAGYIGGRSINLALSQRGWSALEKVGLREEIEKIAIPMYGRTLHQLDGKVQYQPYGKDTEAIYSVSRGDLNKKMVELADAVPDVDFYFNYKCRRMDFKNDSIILQNTKSKEELEVKADWIIGTDGAFSKVRYSMMKTPRFQYSQHFIDFGYKELLIPANEDGSFKLEKNSLHIWPRGDFMLIALPNLDGSFTCTLFLPFEGDLAFDDLNNKEEVKEYFEKYFPDAIDLMPSLYEDFFENPTSSLVTVKCYPWHHKNVFLSGDSSHAIVPFFGQGMNCGFEDVRIFDELMDKYEDRDQLFQAYSDARKDNADAIAEMALDNFVEMRDHTADQRFLQKKKIEKMLLDSPDYDYTSMYQMVSFTDEPYLDAYNIGKKQAALLDHLVDISDIEDKINNNDIQPIIDKYLS